MLQSISMTHVGGGDLRREIEEWNHRLAEGTGSALLGSPGSVRSFGRPEMLANAVQGRRS
jgi:hypothetical protein